MAIAQSVDDSARRAARESKGDEGLVEVISCGIHGNFVENCVVLE
jgi:hypothetical protein